MINQNPHNEEKIVLFIDGELDKDQFIEVREHLRDCSECKEIYLQYLSVKKDTSLFYKTLDNDRFKLKLESIVGDKYKYAIILLFFLFASIGIIILNTRQSEKINTNNLILEDQIDKQIIKMEREIDLIKNQMSKEIL